MSLLSYSELNFSMISSGDEVASIPCGLLLVGIALIAASTSLLVALCFGSLASPLFDSNKLSKD